MAAQWLTRGFVLLILSIALAFAVFMLSDPHDAGPFTQIVSIAIPAWFAVNLAERFTGK
jgi:uncharacterized membrane protein SirB2